MQSVNKIWSVYVMRQKRKFDKKNSTKIATWKLVPDPFFIFEELSKTSFGRWNFWRKQVILDM